MGLPIGSSGYILAQSRLSDFQANVGSETDSEFRNYDLYFLSGIIEGLNERRSFIKNAGVVTRCSFKADGTSDNTLLDLGWEIDLIEDVIKPSIAGSITGNEHGIGFVGSDHINHVQSGTFLSMRLLNIMRYYIVETSMGALTTFDDFLSNANDTYDLGTHLLPNLNDDRFSGQMYRTYNSNTNRHYPCANSAGGSVELLTNPKINTSTNSVDVYASPLIRQDLENPDHSKFYDEETDLLSFNGSGYPGNGDLGLLRAIDAPLVNRDKWPVFEYKGQLVEPKTISAKTSETWPPGDTSTSWGQWTNKKELFKFEADFYTSKGVPTGFLVRNEYFSQIFPVTQQSSGHAFKAIREHFLEMISVIKEMKYFGIMLAHRSTTSGENPLTIDVSTQEGNGLSSWGGCIHSPGVCCGAGCGPFFCVLDSGPVCCNPGPFFITNLQCGDCGITPCSPDACVGPSFSGPPTVTVSTFSNPFPDTRDPIYYTKTSHSTSDAQTSIFGGCPVATLVNRGSERMRSKRIVFNYGFTGYAIQPYRIEKFTTDTCTEFGCGIAGVTSAVSFTNIQYDFPGSASVNDVGGAHVADFTDNNAVSQYDNCTFQCLPSLVGGAGQVLDYRQLFGEIAVAVPTFNMIASI